MAQDGMTVVDAADYMKVTERTIRSYIKKGFLSSTRRRGDARLWLDPLEVEELRKDKKESRKSSVITKREFLQMRAELRRLRSELDVALRILDAKTDPLNMTESYAKDLYVICVGQLRQSKWTAAEITPWVEVFLRIDEDDFCKVATATEEARPWKVFLQLCVAMTVSVSSDPSYATSLELQTLHRQLAEGRRRLRVSALIYAEMHTGVDPDLGRYAFLDAPASVSDSLESILRRKAKR